MKSALKYSIAVSALAAISVIPAYAQDAQEQAADSAEVIVVRGFRSAYADSLAQKRDANQVVDTITAEDIGQFPDQNIAEAIQRISGVSITRNNGEGESVTIRGLDPTFTRVEVDGRTTASTIDSANPERASVLSVFSSDLYNSIEVVKSPTAADVEGGVGGIVRLNTPDPLDVGELRFGLDAGWTDANTRDESEPSYSGFVMNTFADDRVGVLLSATYEELDRRLDKIQGTQGWGEVDSGFLNDDTDPALTALIGGRYPNRLRQEQRTGDRERLNLNAKIQVQASENLRFELGGLYATDDREEDRSRIQIDWRRGSLTGGVLDAETGTLTEAQFRRHRVDIRQFTRLADIENYGLSAGFEWTPGSWVLTGDASLSSSEENFDEWRVDARVNRDSAGGYSIANDPRYPEVFTDAATLADADLDVRGLQFQRRIIGLEEQAFRLDGERFVSFGPFVSVQMGARLAMAEFDRRQGAVAGDASGLTYADGQSGYVLDGSFGQGFNENLLTGWPSVDPVPLYTANPSTDAFTFNDENLWTIEEDTRAVYGMGNFETELSGWEARGNIGVRVVQTEYTGQGRIDIDTNNAEILIDDAPALDRDYTDVLPAFNITLGKGEESRFQLRGAITRAMTRPTLEEINPGEDVNVPDGEIVRGNPEVDPFRAWQYDLGMEYYFGETGEGLFAVSLFYKDVENFIVPDTFDEVRDFSEFGVASQTYQVDTFRNGGEASIQGFEVNVQTPFTFLPGFLSDFGIFANYTYTDSEFSDENGNSFTFPGASENTYNLVGYYERGGFSSRLAYNYRDNFLIEPSTANDGSNALYGDEQARLDFAMRYRFENGVRLAFDVLNINEEQSFDYYDVSNRLDNLEVEGRIYSFSIGYIY